MLVGNSYVNFGTPTAGYPINLHVSDADRVVVSQANTKVYNDLVVSSGIISDKANVNLTQNTPTTIDTFVMNSYRTAKYIVSVSDVAGSKYSAADLMISHNGTSAFITRYGNVNTGAEFVTFNATVSGSNINVTANSTSTSSYCRILRTYVTA